MTTVPTPAPDPIALERTRKRRLLLLAAACLLAGLAYGLYWLLIARFHVFHIAGVAGGDPFGKVREFGGIGGGGDAGKIETRLFRGALDRGLDFVDATHQRQPLWVMVPDGRIG